MGGAFAQMKCCGKLRLFCCDECSIRDYESRQENDQQAAQSKLKNQRGLRCLFIRGSVTTKKFFYFGQKSAIIKSNAEENFEITR